MATARQRSRKHSQRTHHQRWQGARLRAALDASLPGTLTQVTERMAERGYEPDWRHPGRWRRTAKTRR